MLGFKIFVWVKTFRWRPFAHSRNFFHPALNRTLRTWIPCQILFAQWQWFSESLVSFLGSAGGAKSLGLATTSHNFFHSLNTFFWQTTPVLNEHTPRMILQKNVIFVAQSRLLGIQISLSGSGLREVLHSDLRSKKMLRSRNSEEKQLSLVMQFVSST